MTRDFEDFEEAEIRYIKTALAKLKKQKMEWGFLDDFDVDENHVAAQALHKQVPMQVKHEAYTDDSYSPIEEYWLCPRCNTDLSEILRCDATIDYCPYCGQRKLP